MMAWKILQRKTFTELFDFRQEKLKGNTKNWPRLNPYQLQLNGRKAHHCLKCQIMGRLFELVQESAKRFPTETERS